MEVRNQAQEFSNKPSSQEIADLIDAMRQTGGWKIFEKWLQEQIEISQSQLQVADENQFRYWQAEIAAFKRIFLRLDEYAADARRKQRKDK